MRTLGQLVEDRYLAHGATRTAVVSRLQVSTDLSPSTLWAAIRGTRVAPETAKRLADWAWTEHEERLDVEAMITAPPRRRKA